MVGIEVAVGDATAPQRGNVGPERGEERVGHVVGIELGELRPRDRAQHEQRGAGTSAPRDHDGGHVDPALRGDQEQVRLVLDLLHPREREPRRRTLVDHRVPDLLQQLRVRVVARDHVDAQRPDLVVGEHKRR